MRNRLPSQRFVLRRFSGLTHTKHVESQQVGKRATRKEAAARAVELSKLYPRDAVLLVRGDRVLTCYLDGNGRRVSAVQRATWERPVPAPPLSDRTPRARVEGFFQ